MKLVYKLRYLVLLSILFVIASMQAASPVAVDDICITPEDVAVKCYPLPNDTDTDGDVISLSSFDSVSAQGGSVTDNGDGTLQYTPALGFIGLDTFDYTITDSSSTSVGTFSVNVNAVFNFTDARNEIFSGITGTITLGLPSSLPGDITVFSETACSIGNYHGNDHRMPLICAGTLGNGRVLAMPNHEWLNMDTHGNSYDTGTVYINGLSWLTETTDKSIKIAVTPNTSATTWLGQQGYANVVQISDYATGLIDADVLVGWPGNMSAADENTIRDFIRNGGSWFVGDYGIGYTKWWGRAIPEISSNKILRGAGIAFTGDDPSGSVYVAEATGHTSSLDIIGMLANSSSYSTTELDIGGTVMGDIYGVLPYYDTLYATLDTMFYQAIQSINPTPTTPVSSAWDKSLISREAAILQYTPFDQVVAHRTVEAVYGAIPAGAERVSRTVIIDTSKTRWHSTGLYAVPGELVTITVPPEAVLIGFNVRLSGHHDNITRLNTWKRIPYGISPVSWVNSTTVEIASAFGGAVYFDVGTSPPAIADFDIQIDGAIEAPYFVLGETTNAQWVAGIRDNPAPYAELVCDGVAISFPSSNLRTVDDMEAVMQFWDNVVAAQDYIGAFEDLRTNPERINVDVAISYGGLHAGYPTQGPTSKGWYIANLSYLMNDGQWGWFHELGHESQKRPDKAWGYDNFYTFTGYTEQTVNIFANASLELATNNVSSYGWGQCGFPEIVMGTALDTINNEAAPNFAQKDPYPFFWQLADGFDWSMYRAFFQTYHDDYANDWDALPWSVEQEKDQWLTRWSRVSGYNMINYMVNYWALEVSASAISEVTAMDLPDWLPVVTSFRNNIKAVPGHPLVLDIQGSAYGLDGVADVISVESPANGSFVDNGDGTWTYMAEYGFSGSDPFSFTLRSSVGNTKQYTVNIEVTSVGNVVSVDLDSGAGTVTGDFAGSFTTGTSSTWNSLVIGVTGFTPNLPTPLTSGALLTMDGTIAEGVQFTFGGTGQTYNSAHYGSTAPIALLGDYAFLRANGSGGYGPQTSLSFSFSGLTPDGIYDIKYFAPETPASVTIGSTTIDVAGNSVGDFIEFTADGSGIIAGSFTQQVGQNDACMAGIQIRQNGLVSNPLAFLEDPLVKSSAVERCDYLDSITGDVTNPEDGSLVFQIIDGPLWLVMAANGDLSGVPTIADIGTNNFMVRATALSGKSVDTTLEITVLDAFTGELGMADLAGFAANWAMTGCADIPACGGADLTGDSNVTMDDFAKFASNWLSSSAFAKVISVDLDTVAGTVTGDFTGSFTTGTTTTWNSLSIGGNGFIPNLATPLTSGALITMDGTIAEGVQFTFGGTGQTYNCATYGSTAPIALRSDYAFLRADGADGYGPQASLSFSFSGLIPGGIYDVKFFTPGNPASVTIGSTTIDVAGDSVGDLTNLTADGSGIIIGSFSQQDGQNDASMAGIQIRGYLPTYR